MSILDSIHQSDIVYDSRRDVYGVVIGFWGQNVLGQPRQGVSIVQFSKKKNQVLVHVEDADALVVCSATKGFLL